MSTLSDLIKNIFFVLLFLSIAPSLLQSIKKQYSKILEPQTQVGYLEIRGVLYDSTFYTKHLKRFFEQPEIKAILLKIESPGGASGTAETIAHEINLLKKEHPKPIISYSENICTSGGYYIAATTDHIIVAPSTIVGSIGAMIPAQFKLKEFIEQFKIKYETIKSGEYKAITDPFVAMDEKQRELLEGVARDSHQSFIEHIKKVRHMVAAVPQSDWDQAQIFTGRQALEKKLVDEIGSKSNAIKKIKERAIIEGDIEWIKPRKAKGLLGMLTGGTDPDMSIDSLSSFLHYIAVAQRSNVN